LKQWEEKFETLANSANDAIVMIDHKGLVSYWNKSAERIFGYKREEIIGKDLHETLTPLKYRDAQIANFKEFVKTGAGNALRKTLELEAIKKSGEIFPVELSLASLKVKDNWSAVGIVRDISERKRTENKLRESEKKYDSLLANLSDLVFEIDAKGKILFINEIAEKLFNKSLEEIYGIPFYRFFTREGIFKIVKEYKKCKRSTSDEEKFSTLNLKLLTGKIIQLKTTVVKENGIIVGSRGIGRDITEEMETKRQLQQSEEKFRILFEKSDDAIFVIDNEVFVDCNQSAISMLKFNAKEDLLNKPFWEFAAEVENSDVTPKEKAKKMFEIALEKGTNHFQQFIKQSDGKTFYAEIWLTSIPINHKKIIHAIIRDITEQKRIEKEIKEYRENLEKLLTERTTELIQYQEQLEDLVEERTTQFQESEKKYRELLDNSDDAIMRIDLENRYVYINHKATEITGIEIENFLGKTNKEIGFPAGLHEILDDAVKKVFKTKEKVKLEVELPGGIWIDLTYVPEFNAAGEIISALGSGRDITNRKRKEKELSIKTKELELFNQTMINREMRIIELKEEINALAKKMGVDAPYPTVWKNEKDNDEI